MASTFANSTAYWRVRTDPADNNNGGGFDPLQASAGTDYTDSATPITSGTAGACTSGSLTFTDAGANFPTDVTGNVIQLRTVTGTGVVADFYVITARGSSTSVTLDRTPSRGAGNLTNGVWACGGAFQTLQPLATGGSGSGIFVAPTLGSPLIIGNSIYVRGNANSDADPSTDTYDWSAGTWNFIGNSPIITNGVTTNIITMIGYHGRPRIAHCGGLINAGNGSTTSAGWDCKHVSFFRKASTNNLPVVSYTGDPQHVPHNMTDCIFDQNGVDVSEYWGIGNFLFNEVRNTGGGAAGTKVVVAVNHPGCALVGNYIHGVRGPAMAALTAGAFTTTTHPVFAFNTIVNNLSDGIQVSLNLASSMYNCAIVHNTIDNNGGNGIVIGTTCMSYISCFNNIISNHTAGGTFGIKFTDGFQINVQLQKHVFEANCYWQNTNDFNTVSAVVAWSHAATDILTNPGYANAGAGNYKTGPNVHAKGLSGLGGVAGTIGAATNKLNIGAYQGPSGSGNAGLLLLMGVGA